MPLQVRLVYEAHAFLFGELPEAPPQADSRTALVASSSSASASRGSLLTPASEAASTADRGLQGVIAALYVPEGETREMVAAAASALATVTWTQVVAAGHARAMVDLVGEAAADALVGWLEACGGASAPQQVRQSSILRAPHALFAERGAGVHDRRVRARGDTGHARGGGGGGAGAAVQGVVAGFGDSLRRWRAREHGGGGAARYHGAGAAAA